MSLVINKISSCIRPYVYGLFSRSIHQQAERAQPLLERRTPSFTLSPLHSSLFKSGAALIPGSPYTDYPFLASQAGALFKEAMEEELCSTLRDMTLSSRLPLLLLKGCPVNLKPGPTPETDAHTVDKGFVEELFLLGLMRALYAKPYHDHLEKKGEVIAQIIALKGHETERSSRGTAEFTYHTEHIHLENTIDFLSLLCIKGEPTAATNVLVVDDCVKGLPDWVMEGLQKPVFEMRTGPAWPGMKAQQMNSILERDERGGFYIRYNNDLENRLISKTKEAGLVLDYFSKHIKGVEPHKIYLQTGDCLLINNRKVMHSRDGYTPSTTWEDRRWLLRLYGMIDFRRILSESLKPATHSPLALQRV